MPLMFNLLFLVFFCLDDVFNTLTNEESHLSLLMFFRMVYWNHFCANFTHPHQSNQRWCESNSTLHQSFSFERTRSRILSIFSSILVVEVLGSSLIDSILSKNVLSHRKIWPAEVLQKFPLHCDQF